VQRRALNLEVQLAAAREPCFDQVLDQALARSRFDYVCDSEAAARGLAENYAGLPATPDF